MCIINVSKNIFQFHKFVVHQFFMEIVQPLNAKKYWKFIFYNHFMYSVSDYFHKKKEIKWWWHHKLNQYEYKFDLNNFLNCIKNNINSRRI